MDSLSLLQDSCYQSDPNFSIKYSGERNNCAAIYFTSNNLFFPHTESMFRHSVIEKNRYEWTNLTIKKAYKHIFIRDIYKQWYASGINAEINTLDKMIEWLRNETQTYNEIILVGSSGGGYAATIAGVKLKASLILNFNGQWNLYDNIERNGEIISPILKRMIDNNDPGTKYFDIANTEYDYNNVFYFVSKFSPWDKKQYSLLKDFRNTNIISFCNNHHGIPFFKSTLPAILAMNQADLKKLATHQHIPFFFDCKIAGIKNTVSFVLKNIIKKFFQK